MPHQMACPIKKTWLPSEVLRLANKLPLQIQDLLLRDKIF